MDDWKNMDAISLMAKHGALDLPGNPNSSGSDIDAIANAMDNDESPPQPQQRDGDFDIPEEHMTGLSYHQRSGLPPARMIDASGSGDADRMMQQYMGQNGGLIVPDDTTYLDYMNNMQSGQEGGENKVIVGELKRDNGKIIIG